LTHVHRAGRVRRRATRLYVSHSSNVRRTLSVRVARYKGTW
jgi:hypothetical protein